MRKAKALFLSTVLISLLVVALISFSGQVTYTYFKELDISGSPITSWVTDCHDKRKLFGIIEVVDTNRWCGGGTDEDSEFKSSGSGSIVGPSDEEVGTPRGDRDDSSPSYGNPYTSEANRLSPFPYIFSAILLLIGAWMWRRQRLNKKVSGSVPTEEGNHSRQKPNETFEQSTRSIHPLPDSPLRQHLIQFEQALPPQRQRRPFETLSAWASRIELDASLLSYLEIRYDKVEITPQREEAFKQQLDAYLLRLEKESTS
ncbi:hypothetical protein [Exiguobacterium aurantiacum]|uniref:DUF4129 domain-containing protein n=1 Tax=Exiguobacterium aurantiacum TaxID=33987 RepID=A0ABY5FIY5_9BACL|nr:hypothetical protein [Exiguobacterium aurantiacum]UTT41501.1 hypothetical protein NMQ00_07950 [Exiguobacterium aurantiacum]